MTITLEEFDNAIKKSKGMNLDEWEALKQSCPEYLEIERQREEKSRQRREKRIAEMKLEMDPLVITLREMGYDFETLSDFVNTDQSYPDAIPIFIKYLQIIEHPVLREIIARSLTVREARGVAGPVILAELRQKKDEGETRWALANALTVAASKNDVDGIRALLAETKEEDVRERLEAAIKKAPKR